MFGKINRQGSLLLTDITKISTRELYAYFADDNWNRYGEADRLQLLQEVENRRAKIDGRPPIPILARRLFPNTAGGYGVWKDDGKFIKAIGLNSLFFTDAKPDLFSGKRGFNFHVGIQALETVLHEGRHAYQDYVIYNSPDRIAKQVLYEWLSSDAYYFRSSEPLAGNLAGKEFLLYTLQSIEMDARRFARRQLIEIHDLFAAQGKDTRRIVSIIQHCRQREIELIDKVRENLDEDSIREAEQIVLDKLKKTRPDIDTSNLKLFDNARLILSLFKTMPDLSYDDIIDRLDRISDAKIDGLPDAEIVKIAEGRDRIRDTYSRLDRI